MRETERETERDKWLFWGDISDMETLRENLEKRGWVLDSAKPVFRPKERISLPSDSQTQEVMEILKALEDHPDCSSVYTNCKRVRAKVTL